MTTHKLIFIHGMGEGDSLPYYQEMYTNIKNQSKDPEHFEQNFELINVEWQSVTLAAETRLFKSAFPEIDPEFARNNLFEALLMMQPLRYFMTFYVGDIIAYSAEPQNKNGIRKRVWSQMAKACQSGPYSILAHSLGSIIAFDFLYKLFERDTLLFPGRRKEQNKAKLDQIKGNFRHFFSFGSPIGLFLLRQGKLWEGEAPYEKLHNPVPEGRTWLNFYDNQDVAAFPLKKLFSINPENEFKPLEDINVQTGNAVYDSHTKYWENHELAKAIASLL